MTSYLPLLLAVITVPLYAASTAPMNMTYSMEKGSSFQCICGRNVLMHVNGYNYELKSKGNAGGNCSATLVVDPACKLTCNICVIRNEWSLLDDVMNITFTGEAGKIFLKFRQDEFNDTCFKGGRLDILVVEDEKYAKKWTPDGGSPSNVYNFIFALYPKCFEETRLSVTIATTTHTREIKKQFSGSNSMDSNTETLSIVILVFLIPLFLLAAVVSICYCKRNRSYIPCGNQQNKPATVKKEDNSILSGHASQDQPLTKNPSGATAGKNHGSTINNYDGIDDNSKSIEKVALMPTSSAKNTLGADAWENYGSSNNDHDGIEDDSKST